MQLDNPVPVFVGVTLMAAVCGLMSRRIAVLEEVSASHAKSLPLDGLRGLLASSVFFHHAYITYGFFRTGAWTAPSSNFYGQLGPSAVTAFFFISGYLFWRKMLKDPASISTLRLVPNRLRRIMPAYLGAVLLLFIMVAAASHFHLRQSRARIAAETISWLFSGFPVLAGPHLNGFETKPFTGGIYWTLQMEWIFYLLLPLLLWFRPLGKMLLLCVAALLAENGLRHIFLHGQGPLAFEDLFNRFFHMFWTGFFIGMLVAYFDFHQQGTQLAKVGALLRAPWMTAAAAALTAGQLWLVPTGAWYGSLFLAPVFIMVVAGNSFLGLLSSRPFRSLGAVSYSLYVFHGILLHSLLMILNRFHAIANLTPMDYWICVLPIAMLIAFLSALSFRYIEKPFFFPRPVQ